MFVSFILFFISLSAAVLEEIAISIPTRSNNSTFVVLETLDITLLAPICLTSSEHKRFFSSLLVTLTTTSEEAMSSSFKSSKSVPSPLIINVLLSSCDKYSHLAVSFSTIFKLSFRFQIFSKF